ncbi:toxin-activating lysine-acyltransferase [Burkholderia cenocepacia]|uniref:toxin-activating lysine-acyltransferase n=1 Tax=Burkholderia cenocepacia TaxID=95486 RepID=UPI00158BB600|nr:toxin-activating lysine-acyltransferase [Burkholderia cenocepacia]
MAERSDFTDDLIRKKYEELGCVTSLMLAQPVVSNRDLVRLNAWILPAIELRQIKVFFGANGKPVGFVTWAFLSDDVVRTVEGGGFISHLSEWNEGRDLWVIDLSIRRGGLAGVFRFIREKFSREHDEFFWLTRRESSASRVRRKALS